MFITKEYLLSHPNCIFVFGDNLVRKGKGGAALLRDCPNTYGFITKKFPNNDDNSFYRPDEYRDVFNREIRKLTVCIVNGPSKEFLISQLGSGLANKYKIWEEIIEKGIAGLKKYPNVKFLF